MANDYIAGEGLIFLLNDKKNLIGAEIGVNDGITSQNLLHYLDIKNLYLIDPWIPYGLDNPSAGTTCITDAEAQAHYQTTLQRCQFAGEKVIICRAFSQQAAETIPDKELDFVFIDGDHSYEEVKKDLNLWWPKVKIGGIFSGHDFSHGDVNKALVEFANKYNILRAISVTINDMWYIIKPV